MLRRRLEALSGEEDGDIMCTEPEYTSCCGDESCSLVCKKDENRYISSSMDERGCEIIGKENTLSRSERVHYSERTFSDYIDEKIMRFEELFVQPVYHDIHRERSRNWYFEGRQITDQTMNKEDLL